MPAYEPTPLKDGLLWALKTLEDKKTESWRTTPFVQVLEDCVPEFGTGYKGDFCHVIGMVPFSEGIHLDAACLVKVVGYLRAIMHPCADIIPAGYPPTVEPLDVPPPVATTDVVRGNVFQQRNTVYGKGDVGAYFDFVYPWVMSLHQ